VFGALFILLISLVLFLGFLANAQSLCDCPPETFPLLSQGIVLPEPLKGRDLFCSPKRESFLGPLAVLLNCPAQCKVYTFFLSISFLCSFPILGILRRVSEHPKINFSPPSFFFRTLLPCRLPPFPLSAVFPPRKPPLFLSLFIFLRCSRPDNFFPPLVSDVAYAVRIQLFSVIPIFVSLHFFF